MDARAGGRRVATVVAGFFFGLIFLGLIAFFYTRAVREANLREVFQQELDLPPDAFELTSVSGGRIRLVVRDLLVRDEAGDTVLAAPYASFAISADALEGEGPLVLEDTELRDPFLRLVRFADGEWNIQRTLRITVAEEPIAAPEEDRPILLTNVRITGGRALLATPWEPRLTGEPDPPDVRLTRLGGLPYRVQSISAVAARLPLVRVGGPAGWRVDVASLSAQLADPDLRIEMVRGSVRELPDGLGFAIDEFRTDRSLLTGAGTTRTIGQTSVFEFELWADPLHFADVRWLIPEIPDEGTARLQLAATTDGDGRTTWRMREAEVLALDSRISGHLTLLTGGDQPLQIRDTDLVLDPLDLRALEVVGLAAQAPYLGQVRGRVATLEPVGEQGGPLVVDLVANVVPRDLPELPVSTVAMQGRVTIGAAEELRFEDLRIDLRPLHLAALRPLAPEQAELLRGTLGGTLRLGGTLGAVEVTDGTLAYEIGTAAPSRLAAITGSISLEPTLRFDLSAIAQPLALGTFAELLPAFPFERTALSGPIEVAGTREAASFTLNLRGDVGGFIASGDVELTEPVRFRVAGTLDGLRATQLLRQDLPLAGPVSGPFLVEGTTQDFAFDVDLLQEAGRFALAGRVLLPAELPPIVAVEGELVDFRVGTLIGRTGLFLSPLSGPIRVDGGGGAAYSFDVGLRGPFAAFEVQGWYDPRTVPLYAFGGTIAGLDLQLVPGLEGVPPTNLVLTLSVEGRGSSPETFAGRFTADATGSRVGPLPIEAGSLRGSIDEGVLHLDDLRFSVAQTRVDAEGEWGLTRPAPRPLAFSIVSPDLTALTPVLNAMRIVEPRLTGAIRLEGSVAGTLENPILQVGGSGRNLRFDEWRAGTLALEADVQRGPGGWEGSGSFETTDAVIARFDRFQMLRVEAVAAPGSVAVGALVRRDRVTDAAFSGVLELDALQPTGIFLQSLALRLDQSAWQLARPSTLRWGDLSGISVDSLVLHRTGVEQGSIIADGALPPTGVQDFSLQLANVDIGELRRLVPNTPEIEGVLTLNATVAGPAEAPMVELGGYVTGFSFRGAAADAISVSARHEGAITLADLAVWQDQVQVAAGQMEVPMTLAFEDLVPVVELLDAEPVSVRIMADSIPAALITAAIPQLEDGAGVLAGELTVAGNLGSPSVSGWATLRDAAVTIPELAIRYREIDGELDFEGQSVVVRSLTARSGGGASVSGRIVVDDLRQPDFDLSASFNQFRGIQRTDVAAVSLSGAVTLTGRYPSPTLTGRVQLSDGTVAMPPLDEDAFQIGQLDFVTPTDEQIPTAVLEPTFVDLIRISGLEVTFGEAVWVESPEMRIQIGGELLVSRFGPDNWQIFGDLLALRGTYTLIIGPIVREFDVVSGRLEFFGTPDLNPSLDVLAQHRIRATGPGTTGILNVQVRISGTAQFPRLTLTTDTQPPLPESEILSYLIFGRPSFALGEVGEGLARQLLLQEAVGGILAGQIEQLIRQAGLPFDYIRVRGRPSPTEYASDPLGTTTIEVGWQIVPDVFWTVEWGVGVLFGGTVGDTWGTSLEWQIDRQWSTRVAWEPLRRDPLLQRTLAEELQRQFTLQLRRRWEYGITPPQDAVFEAGEPALTEVEPVVSPPESRARPPPAIQPEL
jgi:translocation and assembly module TamB